MSSVDVIVPCYRYGHFLAQCVQSVLSQHDVDVRVLIIDDASPDNTAEIASDLSSDTRVHFIRHQRNRGHIATYNEGIEWLRSDYMLLLSADDYLLPGALARTVRIFESHPNVGLVFGNALALDDQGRTRPIRTPANSSVTGDSRVMSGMQFVMLSGAANIVPTPTAVIRTALQQQVGGYRDHLPHSGDLEMWLRLAARADVGVVNADQAVYRQHGSNMSREYQWLADLHQREAAVLSFLADCGSVLPDAQGVRLHLIDRLSRDALGAASAAFNEGQLELSRQLSDYALSINSSAKLNLPRAKLALKRLFGPTTCRAVNAAFASWSRHSGSVPTPSEERT